METLMAFLDVLLGLDAEPRELTFGQMSMRAIVIFASALVMLRVAHKRFFARRNALDVLLTLVIASTLARAINGNAAFLPTIGVGFLLILVHRGVSWAAARSEAIARLVKGSPTRLIEQGNVDLRTLRRHDLSLPDLEEDLRLNGVDGPEAVRRATLERNGEVSVLKR